MDDADLKRNFKKWRERYWIRKGLWIPDDITVCFGKIKRLPSDIGKPAPMAECDYENKRITILQDFKHCWCIVHISLLHEMAHLYIDVLTKGDRRHYGHGKTFNNEIDRLYALGAFRKLI